ncbi:hypothetical protein F9C07_10423 [Aspergillus flavus]|uniref:Uncharacterized protein n=1 Tax=Aspergillus flavus (strain ATCC 200026 / FGSC A1120 / IAM 13836 / NRRL 3357 / JCM 12722 / SRRC 167) TaxID=332952 RepID=A0A7U2MVS3_ASPFN|nr:hypothetical protein F9C07_10423 [Aspergillus flavus]
MAPTIRRGSFHTTKTMTRTGQVHPDECHCTAAVKSGGLKVHIYTDLDTVKSIDDMKVLGESVVAKKAQARTYVQAPIHGHGIKMYG